MNPSNKNSKKMANIICSICIEHLLTDKDEVDNVITDCGHVYHAACLEQWMGRSHDCPDCNKLILNRQKVFLSTTDFDSQKESMRMFFKYLMSSMGSMRKMSLLDCDQPEDDINNLCNFLHGDEMGIQSVLKEFMSDHISQLADDLFSTHVNIIQLKDMINQRDIQIMEMNDEITDLKLKSLEKENQTIGNQTLGNEKQSLENEKEQKLEFEKLTETNLESEENVENEIKAENQ